MEAWIPPHRVRGRLDQTQVKMATIILVSFILRVCQQRMQATTNVYRQMGEEDMSQSAAGRGSLSSVSVLYSFCLL